MVAPELVELEHAVDALDAQTARRVACLVLECRASLSDALSAVQMADTVVEREQCLREGGGRRSWSQVFGGLWGGRRQRAGGSF